MRKQDSNEIQRLITRDKSYAYISLLTPATDCVLGMGDCKVDDLTITRLVTRDKSNDYPSLLTLSWLYLNIYEKIPFLVLPLWYEEQERCENQTVV